MSRNVWESECQGCISMTKDGGLVSGVFFICAYKSKILQQFSSCVSQLSHDGAQFKHFVQDVRVYCGMYMGQLDISADISLHVVGMVEVRAV